MLFFKSKAVKELETVVHEIDVNLANNYKDVAHAKRRLLGERTEALHAEGKLKEKDYRFFRTKYETYTRVMKDYHH